MAIWTSELGENLVVIICRVCGLGANFRLSSKHEVEVKNWPMHRSRSGALPHLSELNHSTGTNLEKRSQLSEL